MDTLIPILVFGSTFALLAIWAIASRKKGGCCGSDDKDKEGCRPCKPEDKSAKE